MLSNLENCKRYRIKQGTYIFSFFLDNFFTSSLLLDVLRERGRLVRRGTIRVNRIKKCSLTSLVLMKKTIRCTSEYCSQTMKYSYSHRCYKLPSSKSYDASQKKFSERKKKQV